MMPVTLALVLLVLLALALIGLANRQRELDPPVVQPSAIQPGASRATLFVLVHGLKGSGAKTWADVRPALKPHGDVIELNYDASPLSNAEPVELARAISTEIGRAYASGKYERIVLVGHSIGSLLARKAYLVSAAERQSPGSPTAWAAAVERIVLLAGMNRGWDVTGKRPLDMSWLRRASFFIGAWFGRLTGTGKLVLGVEAGAPFVSNLRLEWMRWFAAGSQRTPLVVQLLGDIDDVVSDDDNKDLRAAASKNFFWLKVRGTGHGAIVDFRGTEGARDGYDGIGPYRRQKLLLAATGTVDAISAENEEQPFQTDDKVEHIVFVLHGIRDLGEWSAHFEEELLERYKETSKNDKKLIVVSVRYGYFSMASFLFRPDRQKYVRWFMDEYTETLARYPNAEKIDFIGHSNGTYLLSSALEQYQSLKVDRIIFGGSVVRTDYDWAKIFSRGQVKAVRNYVAADDWIVALFPRLFEQRWARFMGNDVGSAGFNGFEPPQAAAAAQLSVENIGYLRGSHAAFLGAVPQIVDYLLRPSGAAAESVDLPGRGRWHWLKRLSDYAPWLVWLALATPLVWVGVRVAVAANEFAWVPILLYIMLVFSILATA